ncbi:MAG: hypothetical protein IPJ60_12910 [Sphingobacteriaceae bacterium]|nr:hypothetical protein [Sphingobacteriaceae bacterium]
MIQEDREIINKVTSDYGAQAVVACVDIKKRLFGQKSPYSHISHKNKAAIVEYANFLRMKLAGELNGAKR